jgi:hypothetical protein
MKTIWQVLRIAFWMLPAQRLMLIAGVVLTIGFWLAGKWFAPVLLLAIVLPLFTGGVFLRQLSAPRYAQLWPRGRGRLLAGAFSVMIASTALYLIAYWPAIATAPPEFKARIIEGLGLQYVVLFVFWTQCTIGMFVASRKPVWALVTVVAWLLPGIHMRVTGSDAVPLAMAGPVGFVAALGVWAVFSAWFLTSRRIGTTEWRVRQETVTAGSEGNVVTTTPVEAMQRWLLSSGTPLTLGVQWSLAMLVLMGVQLAVPRLIGGDSPPVWVTAMMFGTLSLAAAVIGATSWTIAKRSRWLWLLAGKTRLELFRHCERLMLKSLLAVVLPMGALSLVLWFSLDVRPSLPPAYLSLAMAGPALAAGWLGLMQVHRRFSLDGLAGVLLILGWLYGLIAPLFRGETEPLWRIVLAELALVILLREVAYLRWRKTDWPRAQSSLST